MLLKGKIALVTGASRGIGAATAALLAEKGATVAVNYFASQEAADQVVQSIKAAGGQAAPFKCDVRDKGQVDSMIGAIESSLGPVDILVNNASIGFPIQPFVGFPWDGMAAKLNGEIGAAFYCSQAVADKMIERKWGRIINISSGLARTPGDGFVAHSTAKSGLDAFTRALAQEFGPNGITVNTVAPGLTETDATSFLPPEAKAGAAAHTPLRRIGQPEDAAGAVLFFASDYSEFITGTWLPVDGGTSMI